MPTVKSSIHRFSAATFVILALHGGPAAAEILTLICHEKKTDPSPNMTFIYEGDRAGTLKIIARFGEVSLPATKENMKHVVDGQTVVTTGIQAFGYANVLVPDRTTLETCIAERAKQERAKPDEDTLYLFTLGCWEKTPPAATPTRVTSTVRIGIDEPPAANISVIQTYLQESGVLGKRIALDSFPSQCRVRQ